LTNSTLRKGGTVADHTESLRRQRLAEINAEPKDRAALEAQYGEVFDTQELAAQYLVVGFLAPYVVVRRKCDGVLGSLEFQHRPRFFFNFHPD
jgi:hypothetical protein